MPNDPQSKAPGSASAGRDQARSDELTSDPAMQDTVRRFARDGLVIAAALVVAVVSGLSAARQDHAVERARAKHLASAAQPAVPDKLGFVTVSPVPWANVRLDGRRVGITPRRDLATRPGKHTLWLQCPTLDRQVRVSLDLRAGQALQVLVDLQQDPAKITLR